MSRMTQILALVLLMSTGQALAHMSENRDSEDQMPQGASVSEFDQHMQQMQKNFQAMQEQMKQLGQVKTPEERQALMQQHWKLMQENMQTMHGMWGPGMMGMPMMHGRQGGHMMPGQGPGGHMMGNGMMNWQQMHGYYSDMTPEQMQQRQYMMDRYMSMQQQMLQQMMQQHQHFMMPR